MATRAFIPRTQRYPSLPSSLRPSGHPPPRRTKSRSRPADRRRLPGSSCSRAGRVLDCMMGLISNKQDQSLPAVPACTDSASNCRYTIGHFAVRDGNSAPPQKRETHLCRRPVLPPSSPSAAMHAPLTFGSLEEARPRRVNDPAWSCLFGGAVRQPCLD